MFSCNIPHIQQAFLGGFLTGMFFSSNKGSSLAIFLTSLSLQVLVRKDEGELMGKIVEVVITETGKHFLKGKVLKDNPVHTPSIAPPLAKGVVSGVKQVCS